MSARPKSEEYTAITDEETAFLSEEDISETFHSGNQKCARNASVWIPRIRCNGTGSILLAVSTVVTIIATIQCTIWYERRGSNAPRWRPAFCESFDLLGLEIQAVEEPRLDRH
jgi:hypothetical protein